MKIDRDKKQLSGFPSLGKPGIREVKRGASASFDQELADHKQAEAQYRMQEILAEIDKLNERLSHSLTINDLMRYKKMVKNFLLEATSKAYLVRQERGRNRRGRTLLITIKTIDREMEELVENFIKNRTEPIEVLNTLDKIRGMLVDLMI